MHTLNQKQKKLGLDVLPKATLPELFFFFFFVQERVTGKPVLFLGEAAAETNTKLIFYLTVQDGIDSFLPAPFT